LRPGLVDVVGSFPRFLLTGEVLMPGRLDLVGKPALA
jgi:hypothetical protein